MVRLRESGAKFFSNLNSALCPSPHHAMDKFNKAIFPMLNKILSSLSVMAHPFADSQ